MAGFTDEMACETCCECGIRFGMPLSFMNAARANSDRWWFCPNGHRQHYTGDAREKERLRQERDRLKQNEAFLEDSLRREREQREGAERRASAARGQVTRLKNRAQAGVCPCCNRTFKQLSSHMAQKHPGFSAEQIDASGNVVALKPSRGAS